MDEALVQFGMALIALLAASVGVQPALALAGSIITILAMMLLQRASTINRLKL